MITPKVQFNSNAKYWLVIAALLTGGMVYLGNSNHRVADTNDALSADLQMLVEYLEYGQAPREIDPWKSMPIIQ